MKNTIAITVAVDEERGDIVIWELEEYTGVYRRSVSHTYFKGLFAAHAPHVQDYIPE